MGQDVYSQAEAQGTSLAVMIPPIGIFAAMVYYQHGFVCLPVVGFIAVGFMIGAYFGARFVPQVSPTYPRARDVRNGAIPELKSRVARDVLSIVDDGMTQMTASLFF